MSILVDKNTRVIVQGITGSAGEFHAKGCREYGTKIVGGVSPGKGGSSVVHLPVFDTVKEAVLKTEAQASMIFVPAPFAADAILEAANAGLSLIVCITEGIPALEMARVKDRLRSHAGARLIGPNCPGIITPAECKIGIMPGYIHRRGNVGVISRSGTLTYEAVWQLSSLGIGQSTVIGIGGDSIIGSDFVSLLRLFKEDSETKAILLIGEIGGAAEEEAAEFIQKELKIPAAAFVAGMTAPPGKRMGHAGAIVTGGQGTAKEKVEALRSCGIRVALSPAEIGKTVASIL